MAVGALGGAARCSRVCGKLRLSSLPRVATASQCSGFAPSHSRKRRTVYLDNDQWRCTYCGGQVHAIALDAGPVAPFEGAGGSPTVRVVTVDGHEVHRCTGQA